MSERHREPLHPDSSFSPEHETTGEGARENGELTPEEAVARLEGIVGGIESAQHEVDDLSKEILSSPDATAQEKNKAKMLQREMQTLAHEFVKAADPRKEDPAVMEALRNVAQLPFWKRATPMIRAMQVLFGLELGAIGLAYSNGPEPVEAAAPSIAHVEPLPTNTIERYDAESPPPAVNAGRTPRAGTVHRSNARASSRTQRKRRRSRRIAHWAIVP